MTIDELKVLYPDLIAQIEQEAIDGDNGYQRTIAITEDENGNIITWKETTRDRKNALIGSRSDVYVYNQDGSIDTIQQKVYEVEKLVSDKIVKHIGGKLVITDNSPEGEGK